ncbi:hypothetical protein BU23DRAFT_484306, partial [Bimuria novae-zelandiae CBS 107.79]
YYLPSLRVVINKLIICCFRQSLHTFKILNKLILQGYKVFSLDNYRYIYSFI